MNENVSVTIQMKATEKFFPVVQFIMLYKMVLTFESVDEILKCDQSNESYQTVLPDGIICFPVSAQFCTEKFDDLMKLVNLEKDFMMTLCGLNFMFSPVAAVGNLLVIRALWKASSIPTNVRKLFLSLALSDLAVGMFSQPVAGVIFAVMLKKASTGDHNFDSMCPKTLTGHYFFVALFSCASFLNITVIAVDRLLSVLLHLRYQELVTSKRVIIVLVSLWLISVVASSIYNSLPEGNYIVPAIVGIVGLLLSTAAYISIYKVVRHHQNQIQIQLQMQNAQAVELLRQKRSAFNALSFYLVFLACYLPYNASAVLHTTNSSGLSFVMSREASLFLVLLNSSLNPLVYCWRYREIREIVKSTVKKIFRMNEEET